MSESTARIIEINADIDVQPMMNHVLRVLTRVWSTATRNDTNRQGIADPWWEEHFTTIALKSQGNGHSSHKHVPLYDQNRVIAGWNEFEQQLRALGEWDDDAKPAKFSPLGINEKQCADRQRAKLAKDAAFQALVDEIINKEPGEGGRQLTRDEAWSIAYDRMH